MAKVYMPLLSAQASGKLAKSMVHFYWKGLNVVRQWVIPTNPRDVDQKLVRQKLAAIGKNLKAITTPCPTLVAGAKIYQLIVATTPANNIWNAWFVKNALEDLKTEGNFTALSAAIAGSAPALDWTTAALSLGMVNLTGVAYATTITPQMQLAMGAYAAYKLSLCGATSWYSTYPSNWSTGNITNFAHDYICSA
jgi:hypothetical protein